MAEGYNVKERLKRTKKSIWEFGKEGGRKVSEESASRTSNSSGDQIKKSQEKSNSEKTPKREENKCKGSSGKVTTTEKSEKKPERDENERKSSNSKETTTEQSEKTSKRDSENKNQSSSNGQEKTIEGPGAQDFKNLSRQIHQAAGQSFENLKRKCSSINLFSLDVDKRVHFYSPDKVDYTSKQLLPASSATKYVPIKTTGDGNCLFRAVSILAFGHENRHEEMRVRTVVELAVNSEFYLEDEDIGRRLEAEIPHWNPDHGDVKNEFETEVLKSARDSAWASYWHLQALGTVFKCPVQSVYPEHGRRDIREYYNAVIMPRLSDPDKEPLTIMWTHTSRDVYDETEFTPNHFVPLVSPDKIRNEVPEPKNDGNVPSEDGYKSMEPSLQSGKKNDLPDAGARPSGENRGNEDQRDEKGGIARGGPYQQETGENSKVHSGRSLKRVEPGSFVAGTITHDIFVMDELAFQLDYSARGIPNWPHLAQRLEVPKDKRMLFQQKSDSRPSEKMFAYLFAKEPDFTIHHLKNYFSKIDRLDLVEMLDQSSLEDTDNGEKLREQKRETFSRICLELDCSPLNDWRDFGRELHIPDNVLGKCARSGDYCETVLLIIYTRKPTLQIEEMKNALRGMARGDVCKELSKLQENSTIQTLLEDYDVLSKVCDLLDDDKLPENWKVFAQKFGVSTKECECLCPASVHSPTKMLMEYLSQVKPNLTLESFLRAVLQINRRDVVDVSLKEFFDRSDIDRIVDNIQRSGTVQKVDQARESLNALNLL